MEESAPLDGPLYCRCPSMHVASTTRAEIQQPTNMPPPIATHAIYTQGIRQYALCVTKDKKNKKMLFNLNRVSTSSFPELS